MVAPVINTTRPTNVYLYLIKNTKYAGNKAKKNTANLLLNLHPRLCGGSISISHFNALDVDTVFGTNAGFWVMPSTLLDGNFDTFIISGHQRFASLYDNIISIVQ